MFREQSKKPFAERGWDDSLTYAMLNDAIDTINQEEKRERKKR
jgi:hypothetical protein